MTNQSIELLFGFTVPIRTKKIKKSVVSLLKDLKVWNEEQERLENISDFMLMLRNPYPENMAFVDRYKPILQVSKSINRHNHQQTEKALRSEPAITFVRRSVLAYNPKLDLNRDPNRLKTALAIYEDHFFDHGGVDFLTKTYFALDENEVVVAFVLLIIMLEHQELIFKTDEGDEDERSLFDILSKEMDQILHVDKQPDEAKEDNQFKQIREPTERIPEHVNYLNEDYSLFDLLKFDPSQKFTMDTFEFDPEKIYICPHSGELTNMPILKDGDIVSPLVYVDEKDLDSNQGRNTQDCDFKRSTQLNPKESVNDKTKFLAKTLSISEASAREALKQNKQDKWVTLVKTIDVNVHKLFEKPQQETFPQLATKRRVQYGGVASQQKTNTYKFDENSEEAKELMAIYHSNEDFQRINASFFEYCLVYYKGNYMKVIEVALQMLEEKAEQSLQAIVNEPLSTLPSTFTVPEDRPTTPDGSFYLQKAAEGKFRSPGRNPTQTRLATSRPTERSVAPVPNLLDLHNHTPDDALSKARQTLYAWWSEELQEREREGLFHKYRSVIRFNDPLTIITGRGLHSTSGPVIRPRVEKLLKQENYIYSEIKPGFIVTGKRK